MADKFFQIRNLPQLQFYLHIELQVTIHLSAMENDPINGTPKNPYTNYQPSIKTQSNSKL
jgi:hypothetical protein